MGFVAAVMTCLRKAADFRGRARRSEFWNFLLFWVAAAVVCVALMPKASAGLSSLHLMLTAVPLILIPLALMLPLSAVAVRRLHDIGISGWWLLTAGVPVPVLDVLVVGAQVYCFARPGICGDNRYGPDPRAAG
jgi:uncharacterized membrane protein YhaH (DUF805 family)